MSTAETIYLDNHATTRCDPRVVEALVPMLVENYGNVSSRTHAVGRAAAEAYEAAIASLAADLGCTSDELLITSGATESNNLAILGFCLHPRQRRRHVITVASEHSAVLDPVAVLEKSGFRVTRLPVIPQGHREAGRVDLDRLHDALDDDTALVSIMQANNEIGVLHDLAPIAELCHARGAVLHSDATQAIGRVRIDVEQLGVDLASGSAHKLYGPKGVGLLYVRRRGRRIRLRPEIVGGGQQQGLRSGTLNSPGTVAFAAALRICVEGFPDEPQRIGELTERLWQRLSSRIEGVQLNGPERAPELRLAGNLNVCFPDIEGAALMAATPQVALSSGSACSATDPNPSHVLLALGLSEAEARRTLRFGVGRFNTESEIDQAVEALAESHQRLKKQFR
ncbi:cysteine desulfurase family protein [Candidatus Laterigemmans baculatus]|uniref:cysteine desulfurase family protein n=1 Tax=Candidatus Laterigemmans baculatus TaxID=2770505 RepID=UPI0013DCF874|nr:cysteine desulfurase family protein [Candidatus Laterigemmans baculatus]